MSNLSSLPVLFLYTILDKLGLFDVINTWKFSIVTNDHQLQSNINQYVYDKYIKLSRYLEIQYIKKIDDMFGESTDDSNIDTIVNSRLMFMLTYNDDIDYIPLYLKAMDKLVRYVPESSDNAPNISDMDEYYSNKLLVEFKEKVVNSPIIIYHNRVNSYMHDTLIHKDIDRFKKYSLQYDINDIEYIIMYDDSRDIYFREDSVKILGDISQDIFRELMKRYNHDDRNMLVNIYDSAEFLNYIQYMDRDYVDTVLKKIYPDIDTTGIIIPGANYYTDIDGRKKFNLDDMSYTPSGSRIDIITYYEDVDADLKYMNMTELIGLVHYLRLVDMFVDLNKTSCYDMMRVVIDSLRS